MDEQDQLDSNNELVSKQRKSADGAKANADSSSLNTDVMVVTELYVAGDTQAEVEADDYCSESDSRSTPTKNDKSSSDSGVCSKNDEQIPSTSSDAKTDDSIVAVINAIESQALAGGDTIMASKVNEVDIDLGIGTATNSTLATPKSELIEILQNVDKGTDIPVEAEAEAITDGDGKNTNTNVEGKTETATWHRHVRPVTRNYRSNLNAASLQEEENDDAAAGGDDTHLQNITGSTEEPEQINVEPTINEEANVNTDHQSDVENSPAARRPVDDASEMSTSPASSMISHYPFRIGRNSRSRSSSSSLSDEDDDDDDDDDDDEPELNDNADQANILTDVMNKPKPPYTWNSTYELMRREHGLSGDGRRSLRNSVLPGFNTRFYSSRHVVERMKLSHCLLKHNGCVNCLNFNRSGDLLCSGSDDTRIIVWNWAQKTPKISFNSGHTENIFQTKFINSVGVLDIVSASRDGQVRRSIVPSAGGKPQTTLLYRHQGSVHKVVLSPSNPFEIISAGEDGHIRRKDLRSDDGATTICKVENSSKKRKVRLFSIAHNPFSPQICVCGCDNFVRVYDKRNMKKPVHQMCPSHLVETSIPQVTCSVYNSTGTEVLSSYSDDHIYLFNNVEYKTGEYLHRYRGHYNHKTIKGVNFFGPNSEYVISGSDCGNIFFWDKKTEAIINFMPGDTMGVVNCLEPHPAIPVLATSGLDHNIKIWTPSSDVYPPDLSKLEACVKRNLRRSVIEQGTEFDDREFRYFIREFLSLPRRRARSDYMGNQSSSSSSSDSDENDCPQMEGIQCHTQ